MENNSFSILCRLLEWIERQLHLHGIDCEVEITHIEDKIRNKMKDQKHD